MTIPAALLLATALLSIGVVVTPPNDNCAVEAKSTCRVDQLPATHGVANTVRSFDEQLNWICSNETCATWPRRLLDHDFSAAFVGHGGRDNHDFGYRDFRRTVGSQIWIVQ